MASRARLVGFFLFGGSIIAAGSTVPMANAETAPQQVAFVDLTNNPQRFKDKYIEFQAAPTGAVQCTRIACGPANPCCNSCSTSFVVGKITIRNATGGALTCTGTECTVFTTCTFASATPGPQILRGWVRIDASSAVFLDLKEHVAVPAPPPPPPPKTAVPVPTVAPLPKQ